MSSLDVPVIKQKVKRTLNRDSFIKLQPFGNPPSPGGLSQRGLTMPDSPTTYTMESSELSHSTNSDHYGKSAYSSPIDGINAYPPSPSRADGQGTSVLVVDSVSFSVTKRKKDSDEKNKLLLDQVGLEARAGSIVGIMGPSGAGKSTLLDVVGGRKKPSGGSIRLNGTEMDATMIQAISSFVEQEDHLLGVLTPRETIAYSLRLHLPAAPRAFIRERVDFVVTALGLQGCQNQIVGTPIQRGISGGQKRRVSVGCCMVCFPRILILDEPTSGLDSTSAREVLAGIKRLAEQEGLIVLTTIHQPGWDVLQQLETIVLLAEGQKCFEGSVLELENMLTEVGVAPTRYTLPTDAVMDLLNSDFDVRSSLTDSKNLRHLYSGNPRQKLRQIYLNRYGANRTTMQLQPVHPTSIVPDTQYRSNAFGRFFLQTYILSERAVKNYSRNLLAYGIRLGMFIGMAIMMGTIWIQLGYEASTINDRLSVHFYSVAFLAFMSVAGIPSFLEERALYRKERANGLYGPLPFVVANTIVNIPFLFACSLTFCLIVYWSIGLHSGVAAFFRYLGFLFLALFVAETQSALIASLIPIFVAALAVAAFLNGFWMSVGGYFIKYVSLPHFWKVSFHWMDYQTYAFNLLSSSDLRGVVFTCQDDFCPYPSTLGIDRVSGEDVLRALDMGGTSYWLYSVILVGIAFLYRVLLYCALRFL